MGVFILGSSGCAARISEVVEQPRVSAMTTGSPGPSEISRAESVLTRYLEALGELDYETLRELSTKYYGDFWDDEDDPQHARVKGFRIVSVVPLPDDDPFVLEMRSQLWRQDYTAVEIFHVKGVYPHPDPGEEPVTDYDAIMVRTPKGDWLYNGAECCGPNGHP